MEVRRALSDALSVGFAAAAMGLAFGVLVTRSGLEWWWATIFASVIFAGSLEFLLLGLVTALAPLGQIAAAAFLVNFRHVFYALSFPLHRVPGVAAKAYSTFALTDEAYAVTARPEAQTWSRERILWLQAFVHLFWVGSVTIGALGGTLIPPGVRGLDFAVTALFVVLGIDAFRARRDVPAAVVAVACALAGHVVFGEQMLVAALAMFTVFLLARYASRRA
ncbi:4-azaleucine resistance transporter AzlC [Pseudonocardia hierapolitana]|uniref:4-azaleucine resistance transporter AzlC n=1 Tax=Pseudonocardia hierapolitana TaxID=1128676 RepID=A0A561STR3_9PSEU|nr:AzlC family ABC transporter permease [Pseudonocardia hierapolitana]TWF78231.1 4-azaleucine resistance transporter AzlC [Pseudonocardia hierapolitana]